MGGPEHIYIYIYIIANDSLVMPRHVATQDCDSQQGSKDPELSAKSGD